MEEVEESMGKVFDPMVCEEVLPAPRSTRNNQVTADIVVAGAGLAGICAAVAAARLGVKTVLISDRPVLGGNCSSEIRVPPRGAAMIDKNLWARETGLIEEITLEVFRRVEHRKFRWEIFDEVLLDFVLKEKNINLFLNTVVNRVETEEGSICSVFGSELRADTTCCFKAKEYIDCTGDGSVGFLAGASYRYGREARSEFNELSAPEQSDCGVMGATLLFKTRRRDYPVDYNAPSWAIDPTTVENLLEPEKTVGRDIYRRSNGDEDGIFYGLWWLEICGTDLHQVYDAGEISLHARKIILGLWDYIKNSGKFDDVAEQEIVWIGVLPGKRESRRLIGPTIVTVNDLMEGVRFEDRIGAAGWSIDVHPPKGYRDTMPSTTSLDKSFDLPGITDVPLSALYSKDITNLYFAGRNVSCTHFALGVLRVQSITAMMGQAAGTAAAYAVINQTSALSFSLEDVQEIQRILVRNDQSIIGYSLQEQDNIAREAEVTASSIRPYSCMNAEEKHWVALDKTYGLFVAVGENVPDNIILQARGKGILRGTLSTGFRPEDYGRAKKASSSFSIPIDGDQAVSIACPDGSLVGKKVLISFEEEAGVELAATQDIPAGSLSVLLTAIDPLHFKRQDFVFCFQTDPGMDLFSAATVTNGMIRPEGVPNLFASGKIIPGTPEEITLSWKTPRTVSRIEVVFVTNLHGDRFVPKIPPFEHLVKEYRLIAETDSGEQVVIDHETSNLQRLRCYDVRELGLTRLTLEMHKTWGIPYAQVHEIRVY